MHRILEHHWWPLYGQIALDKLTVSQIEDLITLKSEKLSPKMINQIILAMREVFDEAIRIGDLEKSPFDKVTMLQNRSKARGMLTPEEGFKALSKWEYFGSPVLWALNLTAATTGARAGELRGLKVKCVHPDRIEIAGVIRLGVGFVEDTKTAKFRWISIPRKTADVLAELCRGKDPEDFVFGEMTNLKTAESLNDALVASKILTEKQRKERFIDFHSWRHWFNSMIRRKASDAALRSATGHSTEAMTENYFHQIESHLTEVRKAQNNVFGEI